MAGSDAGPPSCPAFTPAYKTSGVLPRGTYTLVVYRCVSNPLPGAPLCEVHATRPLRVGVGDPVQVPVTGALGSCVLVGLALARGRAR